MTRTSQLILLILVLGFFVTGCGAQIERDPAVTFMYWMETYQDDLAMKEWLEEYSTTSGKVIEPLPTPIDGYDQKLIILFGAQSAPDLFILTPDRFPLFEDKEALLSLNHFYLEAGMELPDKEKYPYLYDSDGLVYGVPAGEQIYVIFSRARNEQESWQLLKFLMQKLEVF